MSLEAWSWLFLIGYVGLMLVFGWIGARRVGNADDFATARSSYGPLFLGLAYAATTASGATFLGLPGLAYDLGMTTIWSSFLYPIGVYLGVLICMRLVSRAGNKYGSRSIPEYLGERYQSELIRLLVSAFSLLLFFYLAGQLVSGLVMFETMLGLQPMWALGITAVVLAIYVFLGGAHADILTDGVQGFVMVLIGLLVIGLFLTGYGIDGGVAGIARELGSQNKNLVGWLNVTSPLYHSWWSIVAIILSHIPLGLLPHIGNKLWALDDQGQRNQFVWLAFTFGITLGMLGLGGLLARAVLGDGLASGNTALPELFIELFPTWLAALLGIGILAAVMSTADGLVVSSSQIVANDFYRCTIVPRLKQRPDDATVDRNVLRISRWSTLVVLGICTAMAYALMNVNVALVVWMGNGGMMAAFAGPLVLGALWRGVTRAGALAGLVSGAAVFGVLHSGLIEASAFAGGPLAGIAAWLEGEAPSPYSCASIGELVSLATTWVVSKLTAELPESHLDELFPEEEAHAAR